MFRKLFGVLSVAVLLCAGVVMAEEHRGKITKVDADANKITISVDGKDTEFTVDKDAKMPKRKSKDGTEKTMTLKDLARQVEKSKDGSVKATVVTEKKGGKEIVTEIKTGGGRPKGGDK